MMIRKMVFLTVLSMLICSANANDWTRFRGPNGSGVSASGAGVPVKWSDSENVKWKKELPGPGLSCPIVCGDRVVLTCWTGYAAGDEKSSIGALKRNVLCLDRATGDTLWSAEEAAVQPEDEYGGMFAQNGYASHTPATDGERVYVFYGKSGVLAYDFADGKRLWHQSVGENRERRGWGSASSPIVHDGMVIVPAFIEGDSLVALDAKTGEVKWKQEAPGYTSNWSTPILVKAGERTDLVLSVPGEVWGLNPANGKLRWYCEVPGSDDARASVIAHGDIVIAMAGGRGANTSVAVRAGGKGDVNETHKVWEGRDISSISTPVIRDDRFYVVNNKVATSVDLKTGKRVAQMRLTGSGAASGGGSSAEGQRGEGGGREGGAGGGSRAGGGRGGYGGGRGGGQDYSSPVVAGDKLYYASRSGDVFVIELGDEMKVVATNKFASDPGEYSSTPAISDGELFIRSTKAVYCIAEEK